MDVILYGMGKQGTDLYEKIQKKEIVDAEVVGFLDQNKETTAFNLPCLTLEETNKDSLIVITVKDIHYVLEIYYLLKKNNFRNVWWYYEQAEKSQKLLDNCINTGSWGDNVLPKVEMHISDKCNLNCKGCAHFSPLFSNINNNKESKINDIKQLKRLFSYIYKFYILGGEPFLNPDIEKYIVEIRKMLPDTEINIITNGLLILSGSEQVLEMIRDNHIILEISEYEPTRKIINEIEQKLKKHEVMYKIRSYSDKQKFNKPLSLSENSKYPHKCISDGCINIWNGKIARCPTLMYIDKFNATFHTELPNDGIYELSEWDDGRALLEQLRKEVPLCRHCIENEIEWGRCAPDIEMSDFAERD